MRPDDRVASRVAERLRLTEPRPLGTWCPLSAAGVYAWWAEVEVLSQAEPALPRVLHGAFPVWSLLYIGIAPCTWHSKDGGRTVALRVGQDHRAGNIGSSTFRQSLAALLMTHLALLPRLGSDRARLQDEAPLTQWIEAHCGLSSAACEQPWEIEADVIRGLRPPLNITHGSHEYRYVVQGARSALRAACMR
jgi:hypothetical protein